jgi:hypothetical protein
MRSESPRRRASDQTPSSPLFQPGRGRAQEVNAPEPAPYPLREDFSPESGQGSGSRERRQRTMEWDGPERRMIRFS